MSRFVYVGGQKGGTTKTTTSHLLCLGAILHGQPAAYVITDPERKVKADGRPYEVLDGRDPRRLAQIIDAALHSRNSWLIVDGGGNRPDFDTALSNSADMCLLPFRPSEEDLDMTAQDLQRLENAYAWPSAWPTNRHAEQSARYFVDGLAKAFPGRVIERPIYFVNAVSELLGASLDSPSTSVRSAARRAFNILAESFEEHAAASTDNATTA